MTSKRSNLDGFIVGLVKFILGVAIALFVISLAGVATARYFFTQLSSLPERPTYDNDSPVAKTPQAQPTADGATQSQAAKVKQQVASVESSEAPIDEAGPVDDTKVLYKVSVTYGSGLLIRTGAGADYGTIDGIDYDETVEVLEESGRWYRVRTSSGIEGWIKGRDNTRRL